MRFSREDIYEPQLPENGYVFGNMDDYLTMLALSTKAMAHALTQAARISTLQYRVLSIVNRECSSTVSRLAAELKVTLSTISSAASTLCKARLLARSEADDDMRVVRLALTSRGRQALKRANKEIAKSTSAEAKPLPTKQAEALLDASISVIEAHPSQSFATKDDDPSLIIANATFITRKMLGVRLKELGLIPRDYRVMLAVRTMSEPATTGAIAQHLLLKPSDITSCLNNLSALRYITRERCAHNRRQREVKLTESGIANLQDLTPRVFDALYEAGPSTDAMIRVLIETASSLVRERRALARQGAV